MDLDQRGRNAEEDKIDELDVDKDFESDDDLEIE